MIVNIDELLYSKICEIVEKEKITINDDSLLVEDVGLNSLKFMMLVFELEDELNCHYDVLEFKGVRTYGELRQVVVSNYKIDV